MMNILNQILQKKVVKEIDKSELISVYNVISPVLGSISSYMISGGAKTLICMRYTDIIFSLSQFGENCFPILGDICDIKDITVIADISVLPYRYGFHGEIHFLDDDSYVNDDKEYLRKYHEIERSLK